MSWIIDNTKFSTSISLWEAFVNSNSDASNLKWISLSEGRTLFD
jgi:hypothetical protein